MQVKIVYTGPVVDDVRDGAEIARHFSPDNSYIDTHAFTKGHTCGVACGTDAAGSKVAAGGQAYGKSVYATNVDGMGEMKGLLPMASTPTRFAYFERAVMVAKEAADKGTDNTGVTITVADTDNAEVLYWEQMAPHFADQGFEVTITPAAKEEEQEEEDDASKQEG